MANGWGRSATWPTLTEAIAAAQRDQAAMPAWARASGLRGATGLAISRAHGKNRGFRLGEGDVVARVAPDGTVRYGR